MFSLKTLQGHPLPESDMPDEKIARIEGEQVFLTTNNPEEVHYWEIDPDWDGKVFHSACQAVHLRGKGHIPTRLQMPVLYQEQQVCVRSVDAHGVIAEAGTPTGTIASHYPSGSRVLIPDARIKN